jgi:hypothetical protein
MYISCARRYRGSSNNALNAVRFITNWAAPMRKDSFKMSTPPHLPADPEREAQPSHPFSATDQFLFNGSAAMQRIQDIARSLERVSIDSSTSPSNPPAQASTRPRQSSVTHLDPPVESVPLLVPITGTSKEKQKRGRSEKQEPSAASGGVPEPTRGYLEASNTVPEFLGTPQHLLVVIDLNGTLLYRPSRKQPKKFLMRPNAQLFLKYCVETFTVVIWSSARPENVRAMCDVILPHNLRGQVAAIWGRDKFGLTKYDYNQRVQCYKRLQTIWRDQKIAYSHPRYSSGGRWDQSNTVLIDDSLEKARTEPHNLIEVPEWFGDLNETDDILPQVHDHLNHLSQQSNVSGCLRAHPFKPQISVVRGP